MAWTPQQEALVTAILGPELAKRLENNQTATIAKLFDPATPAMAKQFLSQRLNALKTADQATIAALPAQTNTAIATLNAEITLIDSVLATLV